MASFKGKVLKLDRNDEWQMGGRADPIFLPRSGHEWLGKTYQCMASAGVASLWLDFCLFCIFWNLVFLFTDLPLLE